MLFGLGSQMNFAEPALVAGAVAVRAVALASGPEKQRNLLAAGSGAEVISGVILSAPAECSLTLVGAVYDTEWGWLVSDWGGQVWNIALRFHVSTLAANSVFVFRPFQVTVEVGPCAVARVLGSDSPIRVKRVVDTRRGMAQTAVVRDFSQVRPQFLKFQRGFTAFSMPQGNRLWDVKSVS